MLLELLQVELKRKLAGTGKTVADVQKWCDGVIQRVKHMKDETEAGEYIIESCHYTTLDDMLLGKVTAEPETAYLIKALHEQKDRLYEWGNPEEKHGSNVLQHPDVTFGTKLEGEKCPKCGCDLTSVVKMTKRSLDEPDQFQYTCRNQATKCGHTWKLMS